MPIKIKAKGPPLFRDSQITINLLNAKLRRLSNFRKAPRNLEFPVNSLRELLNFESELLETFVRTSPHVFPELTGGETGRELVETGRELVETAAARRAKSC